MKNNYTRPRNNMLSMWREKLHNLIERDIAFVILAVAIGLIYSNPWKMRGLPFPWLTVGPSGHTHVDASRFIGSLICCVLLVAACEFVNAVIRAATEPTAFRNTAGQANIYANTYDDTADYPDEALERESYRYTDVGKRRSGEINNSAEYKRALKKNEKAQKKSQRAVKQAASSTPVKIGNPAMKNSSGKKAGSSLATFITIITITIFIIIFSFAATMMGGIFSHLDDDDTDNGGGNGGYDTIYDSPFYTEEGYLYNECDQVIDMLKDGDEESISAIGEGDASSLINLLDWSTAEINEDTRSIRVTVPQEAFIRYFVTAADDREYMLAVKFRGYDISENSENAEVIGISACPYDPWEKYYAGDGNDYSFTEFNNEVEESSVSVGDDRYFSYSMLTW